VAVTCARRCSPGRRLPIGVGATVAAWGLLCAAAAAEPPDTWNGPQTTGRIPPEIAATLHQRMLYNWTFDSRSGRPRPHRVLRTVTYRPVGLARIGHLTALISEVSFDAAHPYQGAIAVAYLSGSPGHYRLIRRWSEAAEGNGWGLPPRWQMRTDLLRWPALETSFGFTNEGCTSSETDLIELAPSGPVRRAAIPGIPHLTAIVRDRSFSAADEFRRSPYRYRRRSRSFQSVNGLPQAESCI